MKKLSLILFFGIVLSFIYALFFMHTSNNYSSDVKFIVPDWEADIIIPLEPLNDLIAKKLSHDITYAQKEEIIKAVDEYNKEVNKRTDLIQQRVSREDPYLHDYMPLTKLIVKFIFSLMFGGGALYVVLSQKYDGDTQKWAFSVLSLISGVWIGTVT